MSNILGRLNEKLLGDNDQSQSQTLNNYGSIQDAYQLENGDLSKKLHDQKSSMEEYHQTPGSDVLKSVIFGGLDGIVTTFAIICSSYASNLSAKIITILGFANILAAAISMGHGDYFSEKTENDYIKDQYARENWEMENYPDGEIEEMLEIYQREYQVLATDASLILNGMARYKKLFVDHMMVLELGLLPPDNTVNPLKNGVVTFFSFITFGSIPLLVFISSDNIVYSIIATISTLGILGYTRSYFTKSSKLYNCLITIFNGCFSAGAAYGVSYGLDKLLTN